MCEYADIIFEERQSNKMIRKIKNRSDKKMVAQTIMIFEWMLLIVLQSMMIFTDSISV